jgi:hypothetical protein
MAERRHIQSQYPGNAASAFVIQARIQEGVPAITVNQPQEGMDVLRQRSVDLKV